jgi:hypothetical protein
MKNSPRRENQSHRISGGRLVSTRSNFRIDGILPVGCEKSHSRINEGSAACWFPKWLDR